MTIFPFKLRCRGGWGWGGMGHRGISAAMKQLVFKVDGEPEPFETVSNCCLHLKDLTLHEKHLSGSESCGCISAPRTSTHFLVPVVIFWVVWVVFFCRKIFCIYLTFCCSLKCPRILRYFWSWFNPATSHGVKSIAGSRLVPSSSTARAGLEPANTPRRVRDE